MFTPRNGEGIIGGMSISPIESTAGAELAVRVANGRSDSSAALRELHSGDVMTREEFHALYELTPAGFKAELIDGVVFVASPVGQWHGDYIYFVGGLLFTYQSRTSGVSGNTNSTLLLGPRDEPQPDLLLRIPPEFGGRTWTEPGKVEYLAGPPELVIEIAHSTRTVDLETKRLAYQRHGVQEYLVVCVGDREIRWFDLIRDERLQIPADGNIRVTRFPGLWLNVQAILDQESGDALRTLEAGLASPEHAEFVQWLEAERVRIVAGQAKPQ